MLFAVHDEEGRITQSNKVFDPEGYDDLLREHGHQFATVNTNAVLSPDEWFVKGGTLTERPTMKVALRRPVVKAGDVVRFSNIPTGSRVLIVGAGTVLANEAVIGHTLEFPMPVPCSYTVTFSRFPYRDFIVQVEAR
ncbi:hypothetical protein ACSVBT_07120 [Afipia sp. TerB]